MRAGTPVFASGHPFEIELGPGLLGGVFDGVQRPLQKLAVVEGDFIGRGQRESALARDRLWEFVPCVKERDVLAGGAVFGAIQETSALEHRLLVPPGINGRVLRVVPAGPYRLDDVVVTVRDDGNRQHDLRLLSRNDCRRRCQC
jgi:V/A-type H+-transporting ATPase subunit A